MPGGQEAGAVPAQQQPAAPPVDDLYQGGLRDYNGAKYDVAAGEFSDVLKYYPQDNLAGNAQFYLGEIAYRQGDFKTAIKNYDAVLEQFPGNPKAPEAKIYSNIAPDTVIDAPIGAVGGGQLHDNHQPYLALTYCICITGVFPPRG